MRRFEVLTDAVQRLLVLHPHVEFFGEPLHEQLSVLLDLVETNYAKLPRPVAWIDDDTIARHTLSAKDCPPGSQVMLVSSLRRLRHQHSDKAEETIWQLTRALREAVESLTFMGEPVLSQPRPVE